MPVSVPTLAWSQARLGIVVELAFVMNFTTMLLTKMLPKVRLWLCKWTCGHVDDHDFECSVFKCSGHRRIPGVWIMVTAMMVAMGPNTLMIKSARMVAVISIARMRLSEVVVHARLILNISCA